MVKENCYLTVTGLSSAEVVLVREKLLHRRSKMLVDFLMPEEDAKACHVDTNKKIDYDPAKDGVISIYSELNGRAIEAPSRGQKVVNGELNY